MRTFMGWWVTLFMVVSCGFVPPQYYYTHRPWVDRPVRIIPVWISQDIGEADKVEISKAIEQWNYALNGRIKIEIVSTHFNMGTYDIQTALDQNGWIIQEIAKDNPMVPSPHISYENGIEADTAAFVDHVGGNCLYLVRESLESTWIFGITMHEIGHLLGAEHNGHYLMAPVFNAYDYQCVDLGTMRQVADVQGLSILEVNYCHIID